MAGVPSYGWWLRLLFPATAGGYGCCSWLRLMATAAVPGYGWWLWLLFLAMAGGYGCCSWLRLLFPAMAGGYGCCSWLWLVATAAVPGYGCCSWLWLVATAAVPGYGWWLFERHLVPPSGSRRRQPDRVDVGERRLDDDGRVGGVDVVGGR